MGTPVGQCETGSVTSADGTVIGYRRYGAGPGVLLLSGGYLGAQYYTELAAALSDEFTVVVPDRRGRGLSGPPGEHYGLARECEDVAALLGTAGIRSVFGHSSGGLIALAAARALDVIRRVAVYEPALSMYGFPLDWAPRFEVEMGRGAVAEAMVTFSKGVGASRGMALLPRWLLVPALRGYLRRERKKARPGVESVESLLPLQRLDVQMFRETATDGGFSGLSADVLLMGGQRTPALICGALDGLARDLPGARRVTFDRMGHEAPLNQRGDPRRVAAELRVFFRGH